MNLYIDTHPAQCRCTWCAGWHPMRYGLNIPTGWREKYSWFVIKYWARRYIRWCRT
jgi:hypothetical protein